MQVIVTELVRNFMFSIPEGEEDYVQLYLATSLMARTPDGVRQMRVHVQRVP
jgi:hypothetical protein